MIKTLVLLIGIALSGFLQKTSAAEIIEHTVDFPKGDSAWTVTFDIPAAFFAKKTAPGTPPVTNQMKKIDVVRLGPLRHDVVTWSDGRNTEYWWVQNPPFVLYQDEQNGRVNVAKSGNMDDRKYDSSLFTWVGKSTFVDMRPYKGKKCRYYETVVTLDNEEKETLRAWIDDDTTRPLAWSNGGPEAIFTFDRPLPMNSLVLPEKFQKELDRIQKYFVFPRRQATSG